MDLFRFIPGYENTIYANGREPAFVMLLSFVITFILTRGYTRMARTKNWRGAMFNGVHTHHLVFGLVMAFAASAAMFGFTPEPGALYLSLAALFGAGAALVLDEFALIFHLDDVYWEHEGRKSVDAVILGLVFGLLFLMQVTPFGSIANESGFYLTIVIAINIPVVVIAALKGKIFTAVFGVFIPFLALAGAWRLAEPDSIWAKKFYAKRKDKLQRSKKRYKMYHHRFVPYKDTLWDFIGGKISHH